MAAKFYKAKVVTEAQWTMVQQMLSKGFRINSLRFHPHDSGHLTVSVRTKQGTRYFFISQKGGLKRDANDS